MPQEEKLIVVEFELEGYNGDTDETDHLIKWVAAPNLKVALSVMSRLGFIWRACNTCEGLTAEDWGIDLVIGNDLFKLQGN